MEIKHDSDRHKYYYLNGEALVAKVHKAKPIFMSSDFVEMRFIKALEHDNLNKFMGLSFDGPMFLSCWRYCSRGSLKDIIEAGTTSFDAFFMTALIRDVYGIVVQHSLYCAYRRGEF
uniref:Serine-threonine/tyrosine-protein kinase catalytic domain-containing protein n=1 Tax=Acrobeloides nanus TaxID=290746 RepID=A0A914DPC0_9BILA